ncbi:hypothetical protein [Streptodolium elevatio]|uniref:Secreted protein n=1 Tax=Streptodolium elevatio TaxID=3157996 RepID=A0ABV3DWQ8_9ACTN
MPVFRRLLPAASAAALAATLLTPVPAPAAAAEIPTVVTSEESGNGELAEATCPEGMGMVGGGYHVYPFATGFGQVADFIKVNGPSATQHDTWQVQQLHGPSTAYVMCLSSAHSPGVVRTQRSEPGKVAYATCPEGTVLSGGGYAADPAVTGVGHNADEIATNAPSASVANTWVARMAYGRVSALAMCTI